MYCLSIKVWQSKIFESSVEKLPLKRRCPRNKSLAYRTNKQYLKWLRIYKVESNKKKQLGVVKITMKCLVWHVLT